MRRVSRAIVSARSQSEVPTRRNWRRSERILVAVNLTEDGGELVTWALTHGSRSGDAVTVIHIVEPCPPLASRAQVTRWERQKKDMLNILSDVVTYCRTQYDVPHLSIVVQVLENKSVSDAIVQEAQSLEATRIILGKPKSRRLHISMKRMTSLGSLCVQSLEPYCEVFIIRKGKIIIRKHGAAKTRRSLETLLFSNKTQESSNVSEAECERESAIVEFLSQLPDESQQESSDPKDSWQLTKSSSFDKSSSSSSSDSSTSSATISTIDYSRESSFSSGVSEISPQSVLRISNKEKGSSQIDGDKIDRSSRLLLFHSSTSLPSPQSDSPAQWIKATPTVLYNRSRSSSNSLESVTEVPLGSVPELPEQAVEDVNQSEEGALLVVNSPLLEKRKDDPDEKLAVVRVSQPEESEEYYRKSGECLDGLVCFIAPENQNVIENVEERARILSEQPQLNLNEKLHHREEEAACAIVLSSFFSHEVKDKKGEEDAILLRHPSPEDSISSGLNYLLAVDKKEEDRDNEGEGEDVCVEGCSPPRFARTCSAIRYNLSGDGLQSLSKDLHVELPEVRRFSYEELRVVTNDFSPKNVVGTGGASSVYKGQLTDGKWVAIKKLVDDTVGEKEFMMEMMMLICTLNHPNLVTMLGFCAEGSHRLIAYELLARGSLERNLHKVSLSRKLNWQQRQRVAFGASRGLAYLHNFRPKPIVHRDIKTSNILLGEDFNAQISDFGLARWVSEADTAIFDEQVSCAGTFGYLAPECLMYGGFNERTDVFAFGVVLLELISGRRPMDETLPDTSLVLWARTLQQNGRTHCLVDKTLKDIDPQQFKRMMYTAFLCVQVSPEDRPTMERVVRLLDPDCNYSPAILQPNISAPPFMSMPEFDASQQLSPSSELFGQRSSSSPLYYQQSSSSQSPEFSSSPSLEQQLALPSPEAEEVLQNPS